jgi:outer membrane protein OmpA-like peptidoglycan-associated protein
MGFFKYYILFLSAIMLSVFSKAQDFENAKFTIKNMGNYTNTKYSDFGPVISADGSKLYFTSRRPTTEKGKAKEKEEFENVYMIEKKGRSWKPAVILPEPINKPFSNNSIVALSNDGQKMLLFREHLNGKGDLYESFLNGDTWSEPLNLGPPINLTESHETSASIAPDGKTIYFISNRSGGIGGKDIYKCTKQKDGSWSKAENLGEIINTPDDEEAVYIHPDGRTLYFSSKGHESIGGYDIFYSVFDDGAWSKPENIGEPINTKEDDYFLVVGANGLTAYYSTASGRGGRGMTDIYEITFKIPPKKKYITLLKGVITDEISKKPIEAKIEIIDNVKNEVIAEFHSNSKTGEYLVSLPSGINYGINVIGDGYLFHSENFDIPKEKEYQEIIKNVALKKVEIGKKIVLRNIFFDTNKATLKDESVHELEKLLEILTENPKIKMEISGHTDDVGSEEYNQKLSEERAHSVVNYLVGKGIASDRLIFKGYGETQPLLPNINEDGTPNEENRQQNRRTEFEILSNE